jgi:Acetyltransferase (GNAT) domain
MMSVESSPRESPAHDEFQRNLGGGLVLRWSTPDDVERVATLYAQVFRASAEAPLSPYAPVWTRDMFSGRHPHIGPRDFALVEDVRSGVCVAATCLLGYDCAYEGIPFGFGRPELVASLPEYRRRGLIRAIFELIHARSAARGHRVQGITGIPYYYRQFGYEFAASLDEGITVYFLAIPEIKSGTAEPYSLREATVDDIPLLTHLWERTHAGTAVWNEIEGEYWRWAMVGMHADALERWRVYMIAETGGQADDHSAGREVGALILSPGRRGAAITVQALLVDSGAPLVRVVPPVLRGVRALADTIRPMRPETPAAGAITIRDGGPALRGALGDTAFTEGMPYPYAWYLRVADLPGFVRLVAPALERRLAASAHAGYTGDLTIDLYQGGLRLAFEHGTLTAIEDWQRPVWGEGMAAFPPLVFLQALFGYRSLHELRGIFPDVWAEGDATALLDALFPKRPSLLMPLD